MMDGGCLWFCHSPSTIHHPLFTIHHPPLCIPTAAVLRVEEQRQMAIDLQQAGAGQLDAIVCVVEELRLAELIKRGSEVVQNVGVELSAEVIGIKSAGLELQDQFADKPVAGRGRQGAVER